MDDVSCWNCSDIFCESNIKVVIDEPAILSFDKFNTIICRIEDYHNHCFDPSLWAVLLPPNNTDLFLWRTKQKRTLKQGFLLAYLLSLMGLESLFLLLQLSLSSNPLFHVRLNYLNDKWWMRMNSRCKWRYFKSTCSQSLVRSVKTIFFGNVLVLIHRLLPSIPLSLVLPSNRSFQTRWIALLFLQAEHISFLIIFKKTASPIILTRHRLLRR